MPVYTADPYKNNHIGGLSAETMLFWTHGLSFPPADPYKNNHIGGLSAETMLFWTHGLSFPSHNGVSTFELIHSLHVWQENPSVSMALSLAKWQMMK